MNTTTTTPTIAEAPQFDEKNYRRKYGKRKVEFFWGYSPKEKRILYAIPKKSDGSPDPRFSGVFSRFEVGEISEEWDVEKKQLARPLSFCFYAEDEWLKKNMLFPTNRKTIGKAKEATLDCFTVGRYQFADIFTARLLFWMDWQLEKEQIRTRDLAPIKQATREIEDILWQTHRLKTTDDIGNAHCKIMGRARTIAKEMKKLKGTPAEHDAFIYAAGAMGDTLKMLTLLLKRGKFGRAEYIAARLETIDCVYAKAVDAIAEEGAQQ